MPVRLDDGTLVGVIGLFMSGSMERTAAGVRDVLLVVAATRGLHMCYL